MFEKILVAHDGSDGAQKAFEAAVDLASRLHPADAGRLFDRAADQFGLCDLDVAAFRHQVLDTAKGNPGEIVEMCRMASNPMYVSGRHIKFAPLRIDAVAKFLG